MSMAHKSVMGGGRDGRKGVGLLVVKDKGGGTPHRRGKPSVAALHGPAGPLAAGDHLQHDSTLALSIGSFIYPQSGFGGYLN